MKNNSTLASNASLGYQKLLDFWNSETGELVGAGFWHAANALETMVDYMLSNNQADIDVVQKAHCLYEDVTPNPPTYFDDQGWWGLAFIKAYTLPQIKDPCLKSALLDSAEAIWQNINKLAWDNTFGGGCWWNNNEENYKNAITNELFFTLSMRLYHETNDPKYLNKAKQEIIWFFNSGMIQESGLIIDGLNKRTDPNPGGTTINRKTWTYNQGVILGGLVDLSSTLSQSDDEEVMFNPLNLACKIADAATSMLVFDDGILRERGCNEQPDGTNSCNSNNAQFKGIFMRYLDKLNQALPNRPYQNFIQANAKAVWENKNKTDTQFGQVWNAPFANQNLGSLQYIRSVALQSSGLDAIIGALPK